MLYLLKYNISNIFYHIFSYNQSVVLSVYRILPHKKIHAEKLLNKSAGSYTLHKHCLYNVFKTIYKKICNSWLHSTGLML